MRKKILSLSLISLISGLAAATQAQVVVWSQNFDAEPLGAYGTTENFGTAPSLNIISPGAGGTNQAMEISFTPTSGQNVNFQVQTLQYPALNNTNPVVANYTLEFDMQVAPFSPGFNMEISVQGPTGGTFSGDVSRFTVGAPPLPTAGAGYVHVSLPLSNSIAGNSGTPLNPTDATFRIGFGALAFPSPIGDGATVETIDVDNIVILMNTNPPPIPPPTMNIVKAKPGLRIFEQNSGATYNQEGFGTVDNNQSWIGSTPANPTTYKISIAGFPPTANTALHMQFVQNSAINPFVVFGSANAMDWSIRRDASGFFSQTVAWKTNSPNNGGLPNVSINGVTNTSTTGVGTWTLTFTNNTDGTLTAPDGSTNIFSLPPDMVALFANPVEICFGTTPGSPAGYGEFFDINRITITNLVQVDDDDFTLDDTLNTALWNPAFSLDAAKTGNAGSVFQVSTNTPFWVTWTVPDDLFVLATSASLTNAANQWLSPTYYGFGTGVTMPVPTKMGTALKWTLIPKGCLPTVDGSLGGQVSPVGFFQLQNPGPTQY
jgi:hypothetical protein